MRERTEWLDLKVASVVDVPANSSIDFDILLSMAASPREGGRYVETFVELGAPGDAAALAAMLPDFTEVHFGESITRIRSHVDTEYSIQHVLQPIRALHLDPSVRSASGAADPLYRWVLGAIALAVLLIACANFVNLSMALAPGRYQEVGMRRTLGALRGQVARQLWSECLLYTVMGIAGGIALQVVRIVGCQWYPRTGHLPGSAHTPPCALSYLGGTCALGRRPSARPVGSSRLERQYREDAALGRPAHLQPRRSHESIVRVAGRR